MNIETANILLNYRKKNGLSQEELAAKIGVSRQAVSKWERAEASPDTDNLILLADIYGVTLDQLLKGNVDQPQDEEETEDPPQENNEESENEAQQEATDYGEYKKSKVSFKNGIHVHDGKNDVDIGFRGIHVNAEDGTKVHIDGSGIDIQDKDGNKEAYTDENGNVYYKDNKGRKAYTDSKGNAYYSDKKVKHHPAMKFPIWAIALLVFLIWGFCGGWALSWITFLMIPLYYTTVEAILKRNWNIVCYPLIVVIAYILLGMCCGLWHPMWILFLTIPIYYSIVKIFNPNDEDEDENDDEYVDVATGETPVDYSNIQGGQTANTVKNTAKKKSKGGRIALVVLSTVFGIIIMFAIIVALVWGTAKGVSVTGREELSAQYGNNIEIDSGSGEINIFKTDSKDGYLTYDTYYKGLYFGDAKTKIRYGSDTTTIDNSNGWIIGEYHSNINIYLPSTQINSLDIDNGSGMINCYYLDTKELDIDCGSGDIVIKNLLADKVDFDIASGSVELNGTIYEADMDIASGDVKVNNTVMMNRVNLDIASGDVDLYMPDDKKGFTINFDRVSGSLKSDFDLSKYIGDSSDTATYNDGVNKYDISVVSGNVNLYKTTA